MPFGHKAGLPPSKKYLLMRLSFLFAENADVVGEFQLLDIGISREFIESAKTNYYITEASEMRALIKPRKKFAHKGMFGHGLLIAGSYGMGGAALLASRACLGVGHVLVGIVKVADEHLAPEVEFVQGFLAARYFTEHLVEIAH